MIAARGLAAAAAGIALWLPAAVCAGSHSTPPPESAVNAGASEVGYRIAYNVLIDTEADNYEVFIMGMDGSHPRNLTSHPAIDWVYVGGDRLYVVSDRDDAKRKYHLYEMGPDGGELRRIAPFRVRDSWVAVRGAGEKLVVASSKDGTPDLYLIDGDGNEQRRLTHDDAADRDPFFSPDGRQIVWSSSRSGIDELWIMDLETGDARQLTYYPEGDPAIGEHAYHAGPPFWEPHRDIISFCSKRNGNNSIFTIRPDGTDLQQVTSEDLDECWHAWSPDGRYLAYDGNDDQGNYDIYLRDTETGETVRLTHDPRHEQAPVFVRRP